MTDNRIPIALDMETGDPDDAFTLCLLATHPGAKLISVTVTPGTRHQVGVVRHLLGMLGRTDVPVGSLDFDRPKECVSSFHYDWLGRVPPAEPDGEGFDVLAGAFHTHPGATLMTGAPLGNVMLLLRSHLVRPATMVIQGGFAGDSVVPPELRLPKFAGRETCPTYNLNGNPQAAAEVLAEKAFPKYLVSKNVCHGVIYDQVMHERLMPHKDAHAGLALVHQAMGQYLAKKPDGKKFHDPLAMAVAIDRAVCKFREVEMYRTRGEWGSRPAEGTGTFISIDVDRDRLERTLVGCP